MGGGRVVVRWVPGFTWVQFGLRRRWRWDPSGYWAVRGFAKSRHFGLFWVCTMRSDAIERGRRSGIFPPTAEPRPEPSDDSEESGQ